MASNEIIVFIENKDKASPVLLGSEKIYSIPYAIILDAQDFCVREDLQTCYVGLVQGKWQFVTKREHLQTDFYVIATKDSFMLDTDDYIYKILEHY